MDFGMAVRSHSSGGVPLRLSRESVQGALQFGRADDTLGSPHRAQISQFELFEFILLLKLDRQFPVQQFNLRLLRFFRAVGKQYYRPPECYVPKETQVQKMTNIESYS